MAGHIVAITGLTGTYKRFAHDQWYPPWITAAWLVRNTVSGAVPLGVGDLGHYRCTGHRFTLTWE